jgi:hypothetical protein
MDLASSVVYGFESLPTHDQISFQDHLCLEVGPSLYSVKVSGVYSDHGDLNKLKKETWFLFIYNNSL